MTKDLYCQFILAILLLLVVGARIFFLRKRRILCWLNNHMKKKWKKQKKQNKKNEFCEMCNELDKNWNKQSGLEKFISARDAVVKHVANDRNKLLQIKSEAVSEDYGELTSIIIGETALLASVFSIFVSTFDTSKIEMSGKYNLGVLELTVDQGINWYGVIIVLMLAVYVISGMKIILTNKSISRWRGYIMTAIEELENEMSKKEKSKIDRQIKYCKYQRKARRKF